MKRLFRLSVFIFTAYLFLPFSKLDADSKLPFLESEPEISMDFQDASLKDVLKVLSIQAGLNFIASETVEARRITLYMDKVPVKDMMDKLFKANNLEYQLDKNSNIFVVKDLGQPQVETVTKVFYLKYCSVSSSRLISEVANNLSASSASTSSSSSASSSLLSPSAGTSGTTGGTQDSGIAAAVKKILSKDGTVVEDYRTNSLIVNDIAIRMPLIAQAIAAIDVAVPQVLIEVEMLDVSKNLVDKLGFDFSNNPITLILPGGFIHKGADFFLGTLARRKNDIDSSGVSGSVVLGSTFGQVLDFLRSQTDTKYLARPRILTLNNETAEIKITTQESIGVTTTTEASTSTSSASPERFETGVSLRVTPQVSPETGEITMFIYPEVSEATAGNTLTSGDQAYTFRDPEVRSTKSIVRIKDGETVIIGGLIRNEFTQVVKKIPIFGDIPLIGALFRHKGGTNDKNKERELLVFITPRIVKEKNIALVQAKKDTLLLREQAAAVILDRSKTIVSSLDSFEKKKK